jgi:uncharacterized protein YhaN
MFMKVMLYYLDKKEEKKYLPWDSGKFGNANILTYTLDNGQSYTVEKNFNRKATSVYMLEPYTEVTPLFPVHKGNVLFMEEQTGLSLTSFEASVFIKQMEVRTEKKDNKDVVERLVRLTHYGDESIDYNQAVRKLEELKDSIGTGSTGKHKKLVQANQRVDHLHEMLIKANDGIEQAREVQKNLAELKGKKQMMENEIEELRLLQHSKRIPLMHHYEQLENKLEQILMKRGRLEQQLFIYEKIAHLTQKDVEELERHFNEFQQAEGHMQEIKDKIGQYIVEKEAAQKRLQSGTQDWGQADVRAQLIEDKILQLENGLRIGKWAAMVGVLLSVAGAMLLGNIHPWGYSLFALVPVIFLLFSSYGNGARYRMEQLEIKNEQLEEKTKSHESVQVLQKLINDMQYEYEKSFEKRNHTKKALYESFKQLGIQDVEEDSLNRVMHEITQSFHARMEIIRQIEGYRKEAATMDESLQMTKKALDDICWDEREGVAPQKYMQLSEKYGINEQMTAVQMAQLIDEKEIKMRQIELSMGAMNKELEYLLKEYTHPGDLEQQMELALEEKKEYEETREAVDIAKHFMEQSLKEVQQNYAPVLNQYTGDIMKVVTGNKYYDVDTASDLNVFIRDIDHGMLDLKALSAGTIDQMYFALRLAITKMLSAHETLPLIVDEPFSQYDDNRLKNILSFLVPAAQDRQIVLFTCHKRELEFLERIDANYNTIIL